MKAKLAILAIACGTLVGCGNSDSNITTSGQVQGVAGFEDCTFAYINTQGGGSISALRCPNSTTTATYSTGKTTATTAVREDASVAPTPTASAPVTATPPTAPAQLVCFQGKVLVVSGNDATPAVAVNGGVVSCDKQ